MANNKQKLELTWIGKENQPKLESRILIEERDYIYVTTHTLTPEQLQQLSNEVGDSCSLLVLCLAFRGHTERFPNLTIKKIPKQVLTHCEWDHGDYSLKTENLPKAPKAEKQQTDLFDMEGK